MNEGVTAGSGRTRRRRFLLLTAGVLGLGAIALGVCVVLELTLEPAPVEFPPALSAEMVFCPPAPDRAPAVPEAGFWIDRFEVTVHEYREFMDATGRSLPAGATLWSDPWTGPGSLPATSMRLEDARAYASWRGKRLPTSPEWEWAARGPADFRYPWGDNFGETFANTAALDLHRPTLVGTFFNGQSFCGAYDLVGNVWEWTESQTAGGFEHRNILRGGSFNTPGGDAMDAPPSAEGGDGVPEWPMVELGRAVGPDGWSKDAGFRCVADSSAVERDRHLRDALGKLGLRDPLGILFQVRPAIVELRAGGADARRLLARALELNHQPVVRARIEELLGAESPSR